MRILVIDDEPHQRELLADYLRKKNMMSPPPETARKG